MKKTAMLMNIATVFGLLLTLTFFIYCLQNGLFTSQTQLNIFLIQYGIYAPTIFIAFQAVQVVVPILPGSLGCLAGIIFFGPLYGFVYNYIGICLGSIGAFFLARKYGQGFVRVISKPSTYEKYRNWLDNGKKFDKWFALAIFLPVAPDDFLCYLAGLTRISAKRFVSIILLLKPFGILSYSFGLNVIYTQAMQLIGG